MTRKEELIKQLTELTKQEVKLKEEWDAVHQKRMAIFQKITKINQGRTTKIE